MKNSQENRTEAVRRELVSFIKSARLKRGDKLPSQACLRSRLGVGAVTIERALKLFADDGILEIRPKKGVFLLEDNFNGYVGRRIGMVEFRIANYPYGAVLQQSLRTQFVDHACQEIPFIRRNIQKCECDSLDMYDGLARNIARHNLDGILTTSSFDEEARKFFRTRKIPVCSVGTAAWPYGAVVQQEDFCSRAFQLARERGFSHPAVITYNGPHPEGIRGLYTRFFPENADTYCCGLDRFNEEPHQEQRQARITEALDRLWNLPDEKRPDCLVIPDDAIAATAYLYWRERTRNVPHFIYERCEQLPFFMPPHCIGDYFYIDVEKIACAAVELLLDVIDGRKPEDSRIIVPVPLVKMEEQTACPGKISIA